MVEITQIDALQKRIVDLESAGKHARSITAIVALLSALAGAVVGAAGIYVRFNDELRNWESIKQVHKREESGRAIYDHAALSAEEISLIVSQINLPDFSTFALKSEMKPALDVSDFSLRSELPNFDQFVTKDEASAFSLAENLPDFSDFALKSAIPNMQGYVRNVDLPDFSTFALSNQIPDTSGFLKHGDRVTLQGVSTKYLFDYDARNSDELDVLMSSPQEWRIRRAN